MIRTQSFRREIPEIPRSRRFVTEVFQSQSIVPTDDVLLVVSELVTNAVRHGSGEVELRVDLSGADVRLEVLDDGHAELAVPDMRRRALRPGGMGLRFVSELSRRWGSGFDPAGRTLVWAELSAYSSSNGGRRS